MKILITDCERAAMLPSTRLKLLLVDGPGGSTGVGHHPETYSLEALVQVAKGAPRFGREQDLAYILFTSGSTGNPKGVAISHRAALWFVEWATTEFNLGPDDRILNIAPFIFDLSVFDIYATLRAGGTIVPYPDGHAIFPVRVCQTLASQRITTIYLTPSQLGPLLSHGMVEQQDLSALRLVLVAGEVLDASIARELIRTLPNVACYNLYGPTESNVCTLQRLEPAALDKAAEIPIGRPSDGCEIVLRDESGHEVRDGEVGQIFIRSPGLMDGYWHDSKSTRRVLRRFRSAGQQIGRVFYKSGDLGVRNNRGELLFRGRMDRQIKCRGHRIEPAEIEAALRSHPDVADALAVLSSGPPGAENSARLVAYVRFHGAAASSTQHLVAHCSELLPRFMLPDTIVSCEELPMSLTGKRPRIVCP